MMAAYRIFLGVLFATVAAVRAGCPRGFEETNSNCYFFSHGKDTWTEAYASCKMLEATLVEVKDATVNAYLFNKTSLLNDYFWIGLTDKRVDGEFIWETSKQIINPGQYANWGNKEPDGADDENCVLYAPSRNFSWADASCTRTEHYICETTPVSVVPVGR